MLRERCATSQVSSRLHGFSYDGCSGFGGRPMANIVRTGVSLENELLKQFDESIRERGYQNRSEAIRDLIRDHLVSREANKNKVVAGTLTIVYDHHRPNLTEKLVRGPARCGNQGARRHACAPRPSQLPGSRDYEGPERFHPGRCQRNLEPSGSQTWAAGGDQHRQGTPLIKIFRLMLSSARRASHHNGEDCLLF